MAQKKIRAKIYPEHPDVIVTRKVREYCPDADTILDMLGLT